MRSLLLPFLCVGAGGVSLDELAGVDEEAGAPAVPPPTSSGSSSIRY